MRYIAQNVPGKGWTVAIVRKTDSGRVVERAPGFDGINTYTLAQAQLAADNAQRDFLRHGLDTPGTIT